MTQPIKVLRLFADLGGESRFETVDWPLDLIDFAPPASPLYVSEMRAARQFALVRLPPKWTGEKHPSPTRQILVCCRGTVRATPSLGEPQTVGPGDCWLMEDTTGDGHETSVISEGPFEALIVQIP
jgi:hypothetical protein